MILEERIPKMIDIKKIINSPPNTLYGEDDFLTKQKLV